MTKVIHVGSVSIPLDSYVVGGTAILGIRESGKTYAAKGIAEQLLAYNIPIIVFDAIGIWRHLKVAGAGKNGKGFKIVVAGGKEPDLPLTPESAPEIVRAAIHENIPLIIDLYSKELSKADWRKIVQTCFRTLLYENEGLRHIFLEETAEYAPQKVMDGQTYAEVEKLVRMGGNASLGITLINQRAQEVNKAILDLCENLILMRQRGAHAIDSLEKWMDRLSPDSAREVSKSMPHMAQGDAWVFTGSAEAPVRVHTDKIHSFHPDRRNPQPQAKGKASTAVDTAEFVQRLSGELETHLAEVEANDPEKLKAQIRDLKDKISDGFRGAEQLVNDTGIQAAAHAEGYAAGMTAAKAGIQPILTEILLGSDAIRLHLDRLRDYLDQSNEPTIDERGATTFPPEPSKGIAVTHGGKAMEITGRGKNWISADYPKASKKKTDAGDARALAPSAVGDLPKGEATVLRALIGYPNGLKPEQLTVLAGYKRSTRNLYVQQLVRKGFAIHSQGRILVTVDGRRALPDAQPLPRGAALRRHWLEKLDGGERNILEILIAAHPNYVDRDALGDKAGYLRSTRNLYLQKLARRQLIETEKAGVRASKELF